VDPLFLEAEKFGMDIRATTQTGETNAADSGMLFGFFEEEEPQRASVTETEAVNEVEHSGAQVVALDSQIAARPVRVPVEDSIVALSGAKRELTSMSLQEMVATAKKFCRIRCDAIYLILFSN
jgi:putative N-acetylmannosamine-6-phosphate epimerase